MNQPFCGMTRVDLFFFVFFCNRRCRTILWFIGNICRGHICIHGVSISFRSAKSIRSDLGFYRNRMEIIGVTVGETKNPCREIPRAIKLTFWRMFVFYIVSVFLIGTLTSYNDQNLAFALFYGESEISASPFVVAILKSGIGHEVVDFLIACMAIFVFSSANSNFYVAIRTLYGLAKENNSPIIFARLIVVKYPFTRSVYRRCSSALRFSM